MKLLISETTREEREQIVKDSVGDLHGACDGCACGVLEMYEDYIEGRAELREVNQRFHTEYGIARWADDEPGRSCPMG